MCEPMHIFSRVLTSWCECCSYCTWMKSVHMDVTISQSVHLHLHTGGHSYERRFAHRIGSVERNRSRPGSRRNIQDTAIAPLHEHRESESCEVIRTVKIGGQLVREKLRILGVGLRLNERLFYMTSGHDIWASHRTNAINSRVVDQDIDCPMSLDDLWMVSRTRRYQRIWNISLAGREPCNHSVEQHCIWER